MMKSREIVREIVELCVTHLDIHPLVTVMEFTNSYNISFLNNSDVDLDINEDVINLVGETGVVKSLDIDTPILEVLAEVFEGVKVFEYYIALLEIQRVCVMMEDRTYLRGISDMAGTVRHIYQNKHIHI